VGVVVIDIDAEHVLEVSLACDQQPVQALAAKGADEALGVGVGLRRLDWRLDDRERFGARDLVERRGELRVVIAD
jgi:hypothetical protein